MIGKRARENGSLAVNFYLAGNFFSLQLEFGFIVLAYSNFLCGSAGIGGRNF